MFTVYRIYNIETNDYYISYSPKDIIDILYNKIKEYKKVYKRSWSPYFLLFKDNNDIAIESLIKCNSEKACLEFINIYTHFNGACVNYRQNPEEFE